MLKLDKKQKITIGIIVIIFCVLIWQIYEMMKGDVAVPAPTSTPTPPKIMETPQSVSPAATVQKSATSTSAVNSSSPPAVKNNTAAPAAPSATVSPAPAPLMRNQTVTEHREYLQMSDQLQLAKMQSQLLSQELAVAQAKKQIADLNQQTTQVLNASGSTTVLDTGENALRLVYVAKISGKWRATIFQDGSYQTVRVGSLLPDGNLVVRIDKRGVLYREGNYAKLLSFDGIMTIRENKQKNEKNSVHSEGGAQAIVPVATSPTTNAAPQNEAKRQQLTRQSVDVLK